MGDELHVAAVLAVVPLHEIAAGLEDRVDPVLLRDRQRLEDLLVGGVGTEQAVDVLQVARVHVAADQVAPQQQAADLRRAERAARQREPPWPEVPAAPGLPSFLLSRRGVRPGSGQHAGGSCHDE